MKGFLLLAIAASLVLVGCNEKVVEFTNVAANVAGKTELGQDLQAIRDVANGKRNTGKVISRDRSSTDGGLAGIVLNRTTRPEEYKIPGTGYKLVGVNKNAGPNEANVPAKGGYGSILPKTVSSAVRSLKVNGIRMTHAEFITKRDADRSELDPILVSKGYRLSEGQFNAVTHQRLTRIQQARR
ncbi:MAG: hypothetical protein MRY49_00045 [Candidatus Pacebacteria bacterium]|nr:hypothetical protein [Candidatus Paceibacterota bacterium]